MSSLSRRAFVGGLAGLGASAAGLMLVGGCGMLSRGSPQRAMRLGLLSGTAQDSPANQQARDAFRTGLLQLGWMEGQNFVLELRYAEGHLDRLPTLAAELVRLPVDVLVAGGTDAGLAARDASPTVPVVLAGAADPLTSGLVASLARPGGNVTGVSNFTTGLQSAKLVELLHATVSDLTRLGVLLNPAYSAAGVVMGAITGAAAALAIQARPLDVRSAVEIASAFAEAAAWGGQAVYVVSDSGVINANYETIAGLALRGQLASISGFRPYVQAGGLMSYGPSTPALYARAASYVDRILRGAKPADLPVEQPAAFEFPVNVKTVQALGLTLPPEVAAQVTDWVQ